MTEDKLGEVSEGEAHTGIHHGESLLNDDELLHCEGACNVTNVPAKYDVGSRKIKRGCYDAIRLNKEGQVAEFIDGTCIKVMHDNASIDNDIAGTARLCLTTSYFEPNYANTSQKLQVNVNSPDDGIIS
jgi:hypothetical protein